jgi:hypothetical protein
MEDIRWPRRLMIWLPEGRRPKMKWEREVERVVKQKNLTPEDVVNRNYCEKRLEPVTGVTPEN